MKKEQFEKFIGKKVANVEYTENGVKIEFEEEEFSPKDGDFLCKQDGGLEWIILFKSETEEFNPFSYHAMLRCDGVVVLNGNWGRIGWGIANDTQKNQLLDALAKEGLRWNEAEKKVEKVRWRTGLRGTYYCILATGDVDDFQDYNDRVDNSRYNIGNYFKTKEEAQIYADRFKDIFSDRL